MSRKSAVDLFAIAQEEVSSGKVQHEMVISVSIGGR